MKKILENKIQKDILENFKPINNFYMNNIESIHYQTNDEKNKITVLRNYTDRDSTNDSYILNNDGIMIEHLGIGSHVYLKYDIINDKNLLVSRLHKYKNGLNLMYEYKYDKNGKELEDILNGNIVRTYDHENDKLKRITMINSNDKSFINYKYEDDYILIYDNDILTQKYNDIISIQYKNNKEILRATKEFNDKNQLIKYTISNGIIIAYQYDNNKIVKITKNDIIYTVEYNNDEVMIKKILK